MNKLYDLLSSALPWLELRSEEPLARHCSFRIGGPALMAFPKSEPELAGLLRYLRYSKLPFRILGAGTNVLAPDEGVEELVISTRGMDGVRALSSVDLEAACGASLAKLANTAQQLGLQGLEFAHGIPGTVGGGMVMNAGAYGGELVQVAVSARFMGPDGVIETVEGEDMGLSYRHSAFMEREGVVVSARFRLTPGDPETIAARMRELSEKRRAAQPLELPSAGSTFKRPVGGYAAALIQQAGLKGLQIGGAAVSTKHSGFVVNLGGATSKDVLALIAEVRSRVRADSGIELEPEVRIW